MRVLQGVRIDYVLLSPGLLQRVVSCEVISTLPPKWSDHAALLLELRDIPPAQPHPPCALSSARMKRFAKPKASIASMFAKRRADASAAPAAKRARSDEAAAEMHAAAVSAAGSQAVPEKPDVSGPIAGEGQPLIGVEDSGPLASASMPIRCEEQAGRSEASEASEGGKLKQADVIHVSQTGTTHSVAVTPHDGTSGQVLPVAAKEYSSRQKAVNPLKGKATRTKNNSKAGEVPSSPKQKSICRFFTAQS